MTALIDITTTEMAAAIAAGTLGPVTAVADAFARIDACELAVTSGPHDRAPLRAGRSWP